MTQESSDPRAREPAADDRRRFEFQHCAEDARTFGAWAWQAASIFLSAIAVALALVLSQLVNRPWQDHDGLTLGLVFMAVAVGVMLACALQQISRRQAWLARVAYARMRDIEWHLDMRKNIFVDILDKWPDRCSNDDWHRLDEREQGFLNELERELRDLRPRWFIVHVVNWIAWLVIALLIGLFLAELGVVSWNLTHLDCG